jgi:hypothetical protein
MFFVYLFAFVAVCFGQAPHFIPIGAIDSINTEVKKYVDANPGFSGFIIVQIEPGRYGEPNYVYDSYNIQLIGEHLANGAFIEARENSTESVFAIKNGSLSMGLLNFVHRRGFAGYIYYYCHYY